MKLGASFACVLAAGLAVSPAMASRIHRAPTSGHSHIAHHAKASGAKAPVAKTKKTHGQQGIDPQRATAIQAALIREHYLSGDPTGRWDENSQAAMIKFQGDQGWQTKLTPDSRALIKLGLGPDHSGAINASNSANFNTINIGPSTAPTAQTQGFIAGSGISH